MYEEFFSLTKKPFSIVPDPGFFYLSPGHREALAHLVYGIKSDGGFVLLTGDIGTGKTTACRRLLDLLTEEFDVAMIYNPNLTVEELLATICDEFGISYPEGNLSIKVFVDRINEYLLDVRAKGRRAVLILEEAQNLKPEVLEQIRLLTNLETNEHKLLQVIMIGQPELNKVLLQPQLRQLSQRVTARYHLGPLSKEEIPSYVDYRLTVAGLVRGQLFPPQTLKKLFRLSGGLPRLINVICDRALLGAYVQGKDRVDRKTLIKAAREIFGEEGRQGRNHRINQIILPTIFFLFVLTLGGAYTLYQFWPLPQGPSGPSPQTLAVKKAPNSIGKDTLGRPGGLSHDRSMKMAYQALFKEWHINYNGEDPRTVCEQAQEQGLQCLVGKGSLNNLRHMNKPAVLTLTDEKSGEYYGLLTSLQGEKAIFSMGDETRTVDVKEIVQHWSRNYLLLWRVPPEYESDLKPGSSGPLVTWLEKHLALAEGRAVPTSVEQVYNKELVNRVKKFQLAVGIIPDGIVGPKTILPLSAKTDKQHPVLLDQKGDK
ncbi:MAG: peptidoglycan-binding protein [Desulfobacca sp.]|nr:peptidoglycan-binding protein [Desulfobacca sp.]